VRALNNNNVDINDVVDVVIVGNTMLVDVI
jgi:hypothetical protein